MTKKKLNSWLKTPQRKISKIEQPKRTIPNDFSVKLGTLPKMFSYEFSENPHSFSSL